LSMSRIAGRGQHRGLCPLLLAFSIQKETGLHVWGRFLWCGEIKQQVSGDGIFNGIFINRNCKIMLYQVFMYLMW